MANICCSIEMEPRTLRKVQLTQVREVAADVVQKMEPKEASNIFIKDLRSVVFPREMDDIEENANEQDQKLLDCKEKAVVIESWCQRSIITSSTESPELIKEPISAPF